MWVCSAPRQNYSSQWIMDFHIWILGPLVTGPRWVGRVVVRNVTTTTATYCKNKIWDNSSMTKYVHVCSTRLTLAVSHYWYTQHQSLEWWYTSAPNAIVIWTCDSPILAPCQLFHVLLHNLLMPAVLPRNCSNREKDKHVNKQTTILIKYRWYVCMYMYV